MTDPRPFATWKFAWIDALLFGLDHREARIAIFLLQCASRDRRLIFPSQAYVAGMLNISTSAVKRAIARLVEDGWLECRRVNRRATNSYRFVDAKRDEILDQRTAKRDEIAASRHGFDGSEVSPQTDDVPIDDGSEVSPLERADPTPLEGSDPTPNHLKEHSERTLEDRIVTASARATKPQRQPSDELKALLSRRRFA